MGSTPHQAFPHPPPPNGSFSVSQEATASSYTLHTGVLVGALPASCPSQSTTSLNLARFVPRQRRFSGKGLACGARTCEGFNTGGFSLTTPAMGNQMQPRRTKATAPLTAHTASPTRERASLLNGSTASRESLPQPTVLGASAAVVPALSAPKGLAGSFAELPFFFLHLPFCCRWNAHRLPMLHMPSLPAIPATHPATAGIPPAVCVPCIHRNPA